MDKSLTPSDDKNKNQDIAVKKPGELSNLWTSFWHMLDFPHYHDQELSEMEPKIEVSENKKQVTVSAEIPGVAEKDIDVEISSDGYLTISGEKHQEHSDNDGNSYFSEISYGMVKRTIPLPWDLNLEKAEASYDDGVLKIEIPKIQQEKQKVKKLNVNKKDRNSAAQA